MDQIINWLQDIGLDNSQKKKQYPQIAVLVK